MKKILIVSTSPRTDSNSEALAKAFAQGAEAAGHEAELISLIEAAGDDVRLIFTGKDKCEKIWPYVNRVTEVSTLKQP